MERNRITITLTEKSIELLERLIRRIGRHNKYKIKSDIINEAIAVLIEHKQKD